MGLLSCFRTSSSSEVVSIPEEYFDSLVQEFAYDPIRLPLKRDPAQVLYNRKTLETIWDTKHEALNPFTREPFDISEAIPQAELREQMCKYIAGNKSLQVIPDYTKVLSETHMKKLLKKLVLDYKCLIKGKNWKLSTRKLQKWRALWQKLNLLRLYCQYRAENRELFVSIRGYKFLSQVVTDELHILCRDYYSSCDDAKELCKEVARVVDVIGLKESDLATLPRDFLRAFVHILSVLAGECDDAKVLSMVLRSYRLMFYYCTNNCDKIFCSCTVQIALYMLGGRQNVRDISNEDLYNGVAVVKAAWLKNKRLCIKELHYIDVIVNVVNLCISRFKDLHVAAMADPQNPNKRHEDDPQGEKNINLISIALDRGLWLINSIVTVTPYEGKNEFFFYSKQRLQELDIISIIARLVQLALAGFRFLCSSHLEFSLNIAMQLHEEGGDQIRDDAVEVFKDFNGSVIADGYGPLVKILLQHLIPDVDTV